MFEVFKTSWICSKGFGTHAKTQSRYLGNDLEKSTKSWDTKSVSKRIYLKTTKLVPPDEEIIVDYGLGCYARHTFTDDEEWPQETSNVTNRDKAWSSKIESDTRLWIPGIDHTYCSVWVINFEGLDQTCVYPGYTHGDKACVVFLNILQHLLCF